MYVRNMLVLRKGHAFPIALPQTANSVTLNLSQIYCYFIDHIRKHDRYITQRLEKWEIKHIWD